MVVITPYFTKVYHEKMHNLTVITYNLLCPYHAVFVLVFEGSHESDSFPATIVL